MFVGLVRIPFLSFEASVVINTEYSKLRREGAELFFSPIKAGISVCVTKPTRRVDPFERLLFRDMVINTGRVEQHQTIWHR